MRPTVMLLQCKRDSDRNGAWQFVSVRLSPQLARVLFPPLPSPRRGQNVALRLCQGSRPLNAPHQLPLGTPPRPPLSSHQTPPRSLPLPVSFSPARAPGRPARPGALRRAALAGCALRTSVCAVPSSARKSFASRAGDRCVRREVVRREADRAGARPVARPPVAGSVRGGSPGPISPASFLGRSTGRVRNVRRYRVALGRSPRVDCSRSLRSALLRPDPARCARGHVRRRRRCRAGRRPRGYSSPRRIDRLGGCGPLARRCRRRRAPRSRSWPRSRRETHRSWHRRALRDAGRSWERPRRGQGQRAG